RLLREPRLLTENIGHFGRRRRLILGGVVQYQERGRPVVPKRPFGAGEGDRTGGPAHEGAFLQRFYHRLGIRRFFLLDGGGKYDCIGKAVERRIHRRLVELRLVALGEFLAEVRQLGFRRVEGDEVNANALVAVELPELRPRRNVVGGHHLRTRQQSDG